MSHFISTHLPKRPLSPPYFWELCCEIFRKFMSQVTVYDGKKFSWNSSNMETGNVPNLFSLIFWGWTSTKTSHTIAHQLLSVQNFGLWYNLQRNVHFVAYFVTCSHQITFLWCSKILFSGAFQLSFWQMQRLQGDPKQLFRWTVFFSFGTLGLFCWVKTP